MVLPKCVSWKPAVECYENGTAGPWVHTIFWSTLPYIMGNQLCTLINDNNTQMHFLLSNATG